MYKKFILPIMLLLISYGLFGQKITTQKADTNSLISTTTNHQTNTITSTTTFQINNLSGILKNLKELDFSGIDMGDIEMLIDTPPEDSLETIEIKTIESDSGDMVEIIIRDEKGNVKKIVRINEDLVDDYRFDIGGRDILKRNEAKEHKRSRTQEKKPKNFEDDWFALDIGLNGLMYKGSPSLPSSLGNLELDPWHSIHVNVGIYQQKINLYRHYVNFVWGINYDNNDYRFNENINFSVDSTGSAVQYPSAHVQGFKRNKLTTRFLTIPVALRFDFNPTKRRAGHVTIGANVGYRLTSFFKTVREDEGTRKSKVYDDFLLNNFRYGAFVKVGYGNITLFGNYVATPLFRDNAGPVLNPFSFGLSLGGF